MLKDVGSKVFDQDKAFAALREELATLTETIEAVESYMAWSYNQDADPGEEISSLKDVDWGE